MALQNKSPSAMGFRILLCFAQGLHMAAQSTPSLTSGCSENPGSVGTYTENSCESEEGSALLQQSRKSSLGRTLRLETAVPTCDINTLNSGSCVGNQICAMCDLSAAQSSLPNDGQAFFPDFRLVCDGDQTCSQVSDSSPFVFREPGQYMVCKGTETCKDVWRVEDVGAVCCSSTRQPGQTCLNSSFALAKSANCQNDMCCQGSEVCKDSNMTGVESLTCGGYRACSNSNVELERDLICTQDSSVVSISLALNVGGTCSNSDFHFVGNANGMHVVDCVGSDILTESVCSNSEFTFEENSTISMECDSSSVLQIADNDQNVALLSKRVEGACVNAIINLAPGACIDLNCTQLQDCAGLTVNLNGGECYVQGINTTNQSNIPAGCEAEPPAEPSTQQGVLRLPLSGPGRVRPSKILRPVGQGCLRSPPHVLR